MGQVSGFLSLVAFVGVIAIIFYFCCRVKKKPGQIIQRCKKNTFIAWNLRVMIPLIARNKTFSGDL
jgi:hypothetical protein